MSNLFDAKKKKAVVTVSGNLVQTDSEPQVIHKRRSLTWITMDIVGGEYVVRLKREVDGQVIAQADVGAMDVNDAELMFDQYANEYIKDGKELRNAGD